MSRAFIVKDRTEGVDLAFALFVKVKMGNKVLCLEQKRLNFVRYNYLHTVL